MIFNKLFEDNPDFSPPQSSPLGGNKYNRLYYFKFLLYQYSAWLITLSFLLIFTGSALASTPILPHPSPVYRLPSTVYLPDGAKVFQQWCSSCHGDRGQGLTPEWRAEWPEGKQNCWQSKCHASNHPPDGFSFPKNVPAVIGQDTLTKFNTAQDLYAYIRVAMPYWSPKLLSDEEYQAITVFLVEANYRQRGLSSDVPFDNLATILLNPKAQIKPQPISETNLATDQTTSVLIPPWLIFSLIVGSAGATVVLIYFIRSKATPH